MIFWSNQCYQLQELLQPYQIDLQVSELLKAFYMDLTPSSNSAAVNLDRTEAELALHVADTGSEEEETPTQPQKVRHANGRVYREIQLQEKRQKKRKAWFWQYGMLMKEEYKSKVNHEKK